MTVIWIFKCIFFFVNLNLRSFKVITGILTTYILLFLWLLIDPAECETFVCVCENFRG